MEMRIFKTTVSIDALSIALALICLPFGVLWCVAVNVGEGLFFILGSWVPLMADIHTSLDEAAFNRKQQKRSLEQQ